MASPLPTPLAAALGIVPAVLDRARRLPGRAVRLPLYAVSSALQTVDTVRREYEDLADRGERLASRFRGGATAADEIADGLAAASVTAPVEDTADRPAPAPFSTAHLDSPDVRDAAAGVTGAVAGAAAGAASVTGSLVGTAADAAQSAAGTLTDTVEGAADSAAGALTGAVDSAADTVEGALDSAAGAAASAVDSAAGAVQDLTEDTAGAIGEASAAARGAADSLATATQVVGEAADRAPAGAPDAAVPDAEAPKGVPTPKAVEPETTRVDTAASPSVVRTVEQAVQETGSGSVPDHDALPLPDYDHMTLGSLRGRLRALTLEQLVDIRAYEKAHADRLPVVTMLDNRIAKLSADPSATPSGPVSLSPAPEQLAAASGPSGGISPATTNAPPINPPSQGDPTNPAQPRR